MLFVSILAACSRRGSFNCSGASSPRWSPGIEAKTSGRSPRSPSGCTPQAHATRLASSIKAGTVWVNTYRAVSYMSPFGGYKDSGLGRESGIESIYEYLQTKSVWINTGAKTGNPFVLR